MQKTLQVVDETSGWRKCLSYSEIRSNGEGGPIHLWKRKILVNGEGNTYMIVTRRKLGNCLVAGELPLYGDRKCYI